MMFKRNSLAMILAATFGVVAHAETSWVSTETHATSVRTSMGMAVEASGVVAPALPLHVAVSLKLRNEADLDARVERIKHGSTTDYLTKQQFLSLHAPTAAQVQVVVNHLAQSGFRNIKVAPNRMLVTADGSAAVAKTAFNADLRHFMSEGKMVYANVNDAQVPAALGGIVLAVHGLQNAHHAHTMLVKAAPRAGAGTQAVTGHNPTDFPTIYNADSLPAASTATIGIISEGDLTQTLSDLQQFTSSAGYPSVNATTELAGNGTSDTSGTDEWNLDSQDALAAAGGQLNQMIFYVADSLGDADLDAAYNLAVSDGTASVINISLGECERDAKASGNIATDDQIYKSGVAQGMTWSVSSGDSGSAECGSNSGQSYPATSPYVIAVGGTTINSNGTSYVSESTWSGGGGGPSVVEAIPSWQKSAGVLGTSTKRGVPDISFDADPNSGAQVIVNGSLSQIGGTSLAAPLFTGFWARIQSVQGNTLVSPNPAIYKYAKANPSAFHDVTTGSNGGYKAKAGWDYATGWGSLNVANFANLVSAHASEF
ncbi:MAG: S8/S53 family peptidase [Burkholderiales bacterium]|nr:S8/S53 family peptidase [Burkholderiales bacterium]